ncbi:hypothetical protein AHX68_21370 [Salmonella enterica subsp. enterica serovar Muenchen]|nr:hypothetical protein [Salmonella enterica subsp. enterica serovar Muenchen]EDQ9741564.1 hypothetical protein [Salmonella enterica subsp. enterica serovar Oranienburg]EEO7308508.1 hypothetical protein [Salmonella enterica]ECZ5457785.1 hypothetical protein [Salmonella enterica subsp. enterica serovar Muenchen]EDG8467515.1 hypothetical protein [Salmonella enterica subsp. enterica serovar Muenchen]
MHQIFLVTPCSYMHAGLAALMGTAREGGQVSRISRPEEILMIPPVTGTRLVLVPVPGREPRVAALAEMYLWRQELLQISGRMPLLPCVLLSDRIRKEYRALAEHTEAMALRDMLGEILAHPEKAMRQVPLQRAGRELSPLQAKILAGTLAGESVVEMAGRLDMPPRGIFAGRAALMNKLGLKNRLGLMALSEAELV